MPYRLPVNSRRFHGDMRAVFGRQPFRQCHEILGRRLERADLSLSRAIHHMAHAGHHCILVNIKTGTMPMQNFHRFSLNAAGLEPPLSKSRTRAPGLSPARDTIWGAQGFRVRLTDGLARTKINTDLCVDGTTAAYPRLPPVSYPAGRGLRWGANRQGHFHEGRSERSGLHAILDGSAAGAAPVMVTRRGRRAVTCSGPRRLVLCEAVEALLMELRISYRAA